MATPALGEGTRNRSSLPISADLDWKRIYAPIDPAHFIVVKEQRRICDDLQLLLALEEAGQNSPAGYRHDFNPDLYWLDSIFDDCELPPLSSRSYSRFRQEDSRLRRLAHNLQLECYILNSLAICLRRGDTLEGWAVTFDRTCGLTLVIASSFLHDPEHDAFVAGLLDELSSPQSKNMDVMLYMMSKRRKWLRISLDAPYNFMKMLAETRMLHRYQPSTFEEEFPAHWHKALKNHPALEWGIQLLLITIIHQVTVNVQAFRLIPEDQPDVALDLYTKTVAYMRVIHDSRFFTRLSLNPELSWVCQEITRGMLWVHHLTDGLATVHRQCQKYFSGKQIPYRWAENSDLVGLENETVLSYSPFEALDAEGQPWLDAERDFFLSDYPNLVLDWRKKTAIVHLHAEMQVLMDSGILREQTQEWATTTAKLKNPRVDPGQVHRVIGTSDPICPCCDTWLKHYSAVLGTRWHRASSSPVLTLAWGMPILKKCSRAVKGELGEGVTFEGDEEESARRRRLRKKVAKIACLTRKDIQGELETRLIALRHKPKLSLAKRPTRLVINYSAKREAEKTLQSLIDTSRYETHSKPTASQKGV